MCMHGVFLHANRVCTVHTACSGPFNFLQGANAADVILGIKNRISKMNIGNNLGVIDMCMHGVFLHANRVNTVHTACSGPFNFLLGANAADVILGIKK